MKKVLYISGDGFTDSKKKWKIYFNSFDPFSKNYFITNALKLFTKCEIFNISHSLRHPSFILKLESKHLPGSTFLRTKAIIFINYCINILIRWKIRLNSYDLIIFSDNLFFINQKLFEDIKTIKSSKLILFSNISPINLLVDSQKSCIPYYDIIFISDSGHEKEWKELGGNNIINLPISASSPHTFNKIINNYNDEKLYDVTFIGRLDNLHHHRLEILNYLVSNGVPVNIWTWIDLSKKYLRKFPLLEANLRGQAFGEEMIKILSQSKIVLNIHILSQPDGGNLRLFEIPAARSMQISDKCPEHWFRDGHEIVLYKNNKDLLNKIKYYLINDKERIRIAMNGYEKLIKEHTYQHRVKKLMNIFQN